MFRHTQTIRLPNFIVIGAMKAGTTILYDALDQHPQVFMSAIKEPYYFCVDEFGETANTLEGANASITNLDEYSRLFAEADKAIAVGEASTAYLHTPGTAERIHDLIPDVKLICMLRDPVERAYSHYLFLIRKGIETEPDFRNAYRREEERIVSNVSFGQYLNIGLYYKHLVRYLCIFPRDQVGIYLFDDLRHDEENFYVDAFSFLQVNPHYRPVTDIQRNPSGIPKNKWLNNLISRPNPVRDFLQPRLPRSLYRLITKLRDKNLSKPALAPDMRRELVTFYREDVEALQLLLDRDLSHWLRTDG